MLNQPTGSHDSNVWDFGFFNSIQLLQNGTNAPTIDELIDAVSHPIDQLDSIALDGISNTLQPCTEHIIESEGENDNRTPHLNKSRGS